ncbi:MAG: dTMP kinase [Deltaproteobacteria bacterium]
MKGYFITAEGLDGCGKTTQLSNIASYFEQNGREVILTREPGGTKLGEKIRELLLDVDNMGMNSVAELMLYAAARAQIVSELIVPAVNQGKIVICDRFLDSSIAYQAYGRRLGVETVEGINAYALQGCKPDITFFFDISPQEIAKRKTRKEKLDRVELENIDFHERVYNGYLELAKAQRERIVVIDSRRGIGEVFEDVKSYLSSLLEGKS